MTGVPFAGREAISGTQGHLQQPDSDDSGGKGEVRSDEMVNACAIA